MSFVDDTLWSLSKKWPISLTCFTIYGYHLWRKYEREKQEVFAEATKQMKVVNEVLNFRTAGDKCEKHIYERILCADPDCPYKKLRYIVTVLDGARKSLDICIHLLTSVEIATTLIECHNRGVRIRFLCDHDMATNKGSQVDLLIKAGISVRVPILNYHMHSKMAIVDGTKLLTGSVNWTIQGMQGNWDNLVVTSQRDIIKDSCYWFDKMWNAKQTKIFTRL